MTTITKTLFGTLPDGRDVFSYKLENTHGNYVSVINYGAAITEIVIHQNKTATDVALGYKTLEEYLTNGCYLGACIGRVGNRIGQSRFTLNGHTYELAANDGPNHLHGGHQGFDKQYFDIAPIENGVRCSRLSPDGEENYPGNLEISVDYTFDDTNTLTIAYHAVSDADTPINLTNHTYFNLSGEGDSSIADHVLTLNASAFTENDAGCLPTGNILSVENTAFDFRTPKTIGRDIDQEDIQLKNAGGYDHNFIPDGSGFRRIAHVAAPKTGICMSVETDQPGVQFYSGNFLENQPGKSGAPYVKRSGFCLETQHFPNALSCKNFPSIILKAGSSYDTTTKYCFTVPMP